MSPESPTKTLRNSWPVAALVAGGLLFASAFAVGAAPSTESLSEVLAEHGVAVSEAAHGAQLPNDEREGGNGPAVSEAVCAVAHKTPKEDCTHPLNESEDSTTEENADEAAAEDSSDGSGDEALIEDTNHGQQVSQAVHEAREQARSEGGKVGRAVALAACTVNHGEESAICEKVGGGDASVEAGTDVTSESETAQTRGRDRAPGQLKKQGN